MGLDITAISQMKSLKSPPGVELWSDEFYDWEEEQGGNIWNTGQNQHFPAQSEGVPGGLVQGLGDTFQFRAGSYSGYGEWRDDLARAMGNESGARGMWTSIDNGGTNDKPFQELINFSDADGLIGPIVSQKLYEDFVSYESEIEKAIDWWYLKMDEHKEYNTDDVKWFKQKYSDWKHAFDVARQNGMVIFH